MKKKVTTKKKAVVKKKATSKKAEPSTNAVLSLGPEGLKIEVLDPETFAETFVPDPSKKELVKNSPFIEECLKIPEPVEKIPLKQGFEPFSGLDPKVYMVDSLGNKTLLDNVFGMNLNSFNLSLDLLLVPNMIDFHRLWKKSTEVQVVLESKYTIWTATFKLTDSHPPVRNLTMDVNTVQLIERYHIGVNEKDYGWVATNR